MAVRPEERLFFIYDCLVLQDQDDDIASSILYFDPKFTPAHERCTLVGHVVGVLECVLAFTGSPVTNIRLRDRHLVIKHVDHYILPKLSLVEGEASATSGRKTQCHYFVSSSQLADCGMLAALEGMSGDLDTLPSLLHRVLDSLYDTFCFFHGSIARFQQACAIESRNFRTSFEEAWDCFLPFVRRYGDWVSSGFQNLPVPNVDKAMRVSAHDICDRLLTDIIGRVPGALAGCIFHKGRILLTQLDTELTVRLSIIRPKQQHLSCIPVNATMELPEGVRIIRAFLTTEERDRLPTTNPAGTTRHTSSQSTVERQMSRSRLECSVIGETSSSNLVRKESAVDHTGTEVDQVDVQTERIPSYPDASMADEFLAGKTDGSRSELCQSNVDRPDTVSQSDVDNFAVDHVDIDSLLLSDLTVVNQSEADQLPANQSEADQVAVSQSEVEQFTASQSEADQLAASRSEVEQFVANQSEADQLVVSQSEADQLAVNQSEADQLPANQSEADQLAASQSEANQVAVSQSEVEQFTASQSEADQLAASRSEVEQFVANQSEVDQLVVSQSEADQLAVNQSEADQVAVSQSEADQVVVVSQSEADQLAVENSDQSNVTSVDHCQQNLSISNHNDIESLNGTCIPSVDLAANISAGPTSAAMEVSRETFTDAGHRSSQHSVHVSDQLLPSESNQPSSMDIAVSALTLQDGEMQTRTVVARNAACEQLARESSCAEEEDLVPVDLFIQGNSHSMFIMLMETGSVDDFNKVKVLWLEILKRFSDLECLLLEPSSHSAGKVPDLSANRNCSFDHLIYDCETAQLTGNTLMPSTHEEHGLCQKALALHEELCCCPELLSKTVYCHDNAYGAVRRGQRQFFYRSVHPERNHLKSDINPALIDQLIAADRC